MWRRQWWWVSLYFLIPPPPFQTFSHSFYFQLNCYPVGHAGHLPSVGKANKSSLCYPLLTCCIKKAVMVSSPLSFIPPPPFDTFSHSSCSQFNCYPIGSAGHPPSVNQGNKGLPPPSPLASFMETALTVSFLLFYFFPTIPNFLPAFFLLQCYSDGCAICPLSVNPPFISFLQMSHAPSWNLPAKTYI